MRVELVRRGPCPEAPEPRRDRVDAAAVHGPEILYIPTPYACLHRPSAGAPSFLLAALHARYDRQDDRGGERCDGADAGSAPHLQAVPFEPRPPVVRVVDVVDLRGAGRRRVRKRARACSLQTRRKTRRRTRREELL